MNFLLDLPILGNAINESIDVNTFSGGAESSVLAALLPFIIFYLFFLLFFILFQIAVYIYSSLAFMKIGKKTGHPSPGIAWIPLVGKPLLTSQISKMHWWPILLLGTLLFSFFPFGIFIILPAYLAFSVFFYIWRWKTYEKAGHPGWFSLFFLLPVVGYVFLGIVAWSKEDKIEQIQMKK